MKFDSKTEELFSSSINDLIIETMKKNGHININFESNGLYFDCQLKNINTNNVENLFHSIKISNNFSLNISNKTTISGNFTARFDESCFYFTVDFVRRPFDINEIEKIRDYLDSSEESRENINKRNLLYKIYEYLC